MSTVTDIIDISKWKQNELKSLNKIIDCIINFKFSQYFWATFNLDSYKIEKNPDYGNCVYICDNHEYIGMVMPDGLIHLVNCNYILCEPQILPEFIIKLTSDISHKYFNRDEGTYKCRYILNLDNKYSIQITFPGSKFNLDDQIISVNSNDYLLEYIGENQIN